MDDVLIYLREIFWENYDNIINFSEQRYINQFDTIISKGDNLMFLYIVLEWHFLKYDDNSTVIWIYSSWNVIGASIIFDYSKKTSIMDWDIIWVDGNNKVLIITIDEINNLTSKSKLIFNWVLENIKNEKKRI